MRKNWSFLLCTSLLFSINSLSLQGAEFETAETFDEKFEHYPFDSNETEDSDEKPISYCEIKGSYDITDRAKIYSDPFDGQHLRYAYGEADFYYSYAISCHTNLLLGAGYSDTALLWEENPFFRKTHFNNLILSLSGYSKAVSDWLWRGGVSAQVDTDEWNWRKYAQYNVTLWGRYNFCEDIGVHAGFIGILGVGPTNFQPIFGVDFKLYDDIQVNLIYPVNMSVAYAISDQWSVSLAARIFYDRHRVGKHEPLSKGLFEYRNTGAEFGVNYTYAPYAAVNVHIGSALAGKLKIANSEDHDDIYVKLRNAGYIGGAIDIKF